MIDITEKDLVARRAVATGRIALKRSTINKIASGSVKKGNVEEAAKLAGIMAAKNTWNIIPLCHQIPLTSVSPVMKLGEEHVEVECEVKAIYGTGVEMEALSCVSAMLLTVWDMVKYLEKDRSGNYPSTSIMDIRVREKRKGSDGP
ncbi:MAG: cyclic pyranopterin monophosphate synthase MoaC [Thermoplasmata archaeon]